MTDLLGQSYIIMAAYKKRKMDRLKGSDHLLAKKDLVQLGTPQIEHEMFP